VAAVDRQNGRKHLGDGVEDGGINSGNLQRLGSWGEATVAWELVLRLGLRIAPLGWSGGAPVVDAVSGQTFLFWYVFGHLDNCWEAKNRETSKIGVIKARRWNYFDILG